MELQTLEAIGPTWLGIQRWLLRAGAFLLPLVVVWDALDKFALPKLLAARLLVFALAAVLLARSASTGHWTWRRTALDAPLLAFVLSTAISSLVAVNRNVALFGMYLRYEGLLTILTYAALFWLTVQLIPSREDARNLGRTMLAGAAVASLIAIWQSITGLGGGGENSIGPYVRAFGTFGNPVELGTYLSMLIPLALYELLDARAPAHRAVAAVTLVVLAGALFLTFTRAAWVAAAVGVVIVVILKRLPRRIWLIGSVALLAVVAIIAIGLATGRVGGSVIGQAFSTRVQATTSLSEGSIGARLHVWSDTLRLLALRPVFGSGPDSFGLVYPSVQTGYVPPGVDKAHNEILQVAVTNGLVGVLVYYFILATIAVQLWRSRQVGWSAAMLAGLIAYEVALQAEFSWIPAALPFWMFAGAAFYDRSRPAHAYSTPAPASTWPRVGLVSGIAAIATVLAFLAVVPALQADRFVSLALKDAGRGDRESAQLEADAARQLNPNESLYAVVAGNLALDLSFGFRIGPSGNVPAARAAYQDAVSLGTTDPAAFRGLAIADFNLGDQRGAIIAARRAVELDRFDPANATVLQIVQGPRP